MRMKKYQLILMIALGVFSFAASFGFNWFRRQKAADAAVVPSEPPATETATAEGAGQQRSPLDAVLDLTPSETPAAGLTERQLQHLIYDVREKTREHAQREKELADEDQRIALARKSLREDIEQLNQLQETLDMRLASLAERQQRLDETLIEIEATEQNNLQRLGATYDRMDAVQAGNIMINMAGNNQVEDVVKILYFMNDRNAARVLGQIGDAQPEVAAVLSRYLKRIRQED